MKPTKEEHRLWTKNPITYAVRMDLQERLENKLAQAMQKSIDPVAKDSECRILLQACWALKQLIEELKYAETT